MMQVAVLGDGGEILKIARLHAEKFNNLWLSSDDYWMIAGINAVRQHARACNAPDTRQA